MTRKRLGTEVFSCQIGTRLPETDYENLKVLALSRRQRLSDLIRGLVMAEISQYSAIKNP
ncbi:hypothetical protein [Merismopedia glauca]|uniref:Uncharacterized protein n=1 Tax=Merismopedia glauca CCAP 1448/3 TaxID=1296344 RepID=A0A2T1BY62_9CYAN|nr:hypothetical protein [Merismopedia glauca]PSB00942.1 hypothetical protein C7B64_20860 [Merismopedia glauca CCAP 1448/3]